MLVSLVLVGTLEIVRPAGLDLFRGSLQVGANEFPKTPGNLPFASR